MNRFHNKYSAKWRCNLNRVSIVIIPKLEKNNGVDVLTLPTQYGANIWRYEV